MKGSISEGCRYHGVVVEGRNSCGCFRECKRRGATDLFSEKDFVIEGRLSRDLGERAGEGEVLGERAGEGEVRTGEKGPPRGLEGRVEGDGACALEGGLPKDLEGWSRRRGSPLGVIGVAVATWPLGVIGVAGTWAVTGDVGCRGRDREATGEDLSQFVSGKAMIRNWSRKTWLVRHSQSAWKP